MERDQAERPRVTPADWSVDRYRLLGEGPVADGFHSSVWKAGDRRTGRTVAIKVFDREPTLTSPVAEARRLARLGHPGIVGLRDFLPDVDGCATPGMVLEYVEGPRLEMRLTAPRPPAETLGIAEQLARVLRFAHSTRERGRPVVHGDLHPGNVILRQGPGTVPRVKVVDWGTIPPGPPPGTALGHDIYRAPEARETVEPASDFWALGLVTVQLAVGGWIVPARMAATGPERSLAIRARALEMIGGTRDPGLRELVSGLLEPDPGDRAGAAEVESSRRAVAVPAADDVPPRW